MPTAPYSTFTQPLPTIMAFEASSTPIQLKTVLCSRCQDQFVADSTPDIPKDVFREHSAFSASERYDEKIAEVESVLEKLKSEREVLLCRYNSRRHSVSSFRRLPAEVLEEILLEACYTQETETTNSDDVVPFYPIKIAECRRRRVVPLAVSHVCFKWRQLIIGAACFWTSFVVELQHEGQDYSSDQMFRIFLERSKQWSLRVRIDIPDNTIYHPRVTPFLRDLIIRASDLQLHCFMEWEGDLERDLSLPSLRSLTLFNHHRDTDGCPQALLVAPKLTSLSILGFGGLLKSMVFSQHIKMWQCWDDIEPSELIAFSQTHPQLEEFYWDVDAYKLTYHACCEVQLPSVRRLVITKDTHHSHALCCLQPSILREFIYDLNPKYDPPKLVLFIAFLRRSSFTLGQ
ncbi:hypothetical protein PM082_019618 [Marasmius tenuissimus]|nr:hypothetical protein PM082_019618 [Marasmius tenuissimus]